MADEPDVTPKEWMPRAVYYKQSENDDWLKFEGEEEGRTIAVLVLDTGDVFDAALARWAERFDPLKMADIAALFEPLPEEDE